MGGTNDEPRSNCRHFGDLLGDGALFVGRHDVDGRRAAVGRNAVDGAIAALPSAACLSPARSVASGTSPTHLPAASIASASRRFLTICSGVCRLRFLLK